MFLSGLAPGLLRAYCWRVPTDASRSLLMEHTPLHSSLTTLVEGGVSDNVPYPPVCVSSSTASTEQQPGQDHDPEWEELLGEGLKAQPRSTRETQPQAWDEDLRASLLRQGRLGLTPREGRRQKKFRPSQSAWPVPYVGEAWKAYEQRVNSFMIATAFRTMNADGIVPGRKLTLAELRSHVPGTAQLEETVMGIALDQGGDYISLRSDALDRYSRHEGVFTGSIEYQQIERMVSRAVTFSWEHWRADYASQRSAWGRTGGEISKRPKVFTHDLLSGLEGLSKREQAEALGCSPATVGRLRRERAAAIAEGLI